MPAWLNTPHFADMSANDIQLATGPATFLGADGNGNTGRDTQLTGDALEAIDNFRAMEPRRALPPTELAPVNQVNISSSVDTEFHQFLNVFQQVQQRTETNRQTRKGKGKGKGNSNRDDDTATEATIDYDGDDRTCALCQHDYLHGDNVIRLVCRHIFHGDCWMDNQINNPAGASSCPVCRGRGRIIARWQFIAPESDASGYETAGSMFPWWPAPGAQPEHYYHAATQLPDGRLSIIVDPGAWTNLAGKKWANAQATRAIRAGLMPNQTKMERPLSVQGVGNGFQHAVWQAMLPIACRNDDDGNSKLHRFEVPTLEGSGGDVPALLGLRSISAKQGVLETKTGSERLSFPGPGGYKIEWSPGTEHFALEKAPSGHLVIPCDGFADVQTSTGGLPPATVTMHANLGNPEEMASSSSSGTNRQEPSGTIGSQTLDPAVQSPTVGQSPASNL